LKYRERVAVHRKLTPSIIELNIGLNTFEKCFKKYLVF
jgi:hypothetical protein